MKKKSNKIKKVKGYVSLEFLRNGWKGDDSAVFVYRKRSKGETWFVPCTIEFALPVTKKK